MTELRQHLPEYLKQVQAGEAIAITLHGKTIAHIIPGRAKSEREAALSRLDALRGTVLLVISLRLWMKNGRAMLIICDTHILLGS